MRIGSTRMRWILWLACGSLIFLFILFKHLTGNLDPNTKEISIKSEYLPYRLHHNRKSRSRQIIDPDKELDHIPSTTPVIESRNIISFPQNFWKLIETNSINSTLMISIVDVDFFQFAVNFYQLSVVKHKIKNFLAICLDDRVAQQLSTLDIPCAVVNVSVDISTGASDFGAQSYYQKTNLKTVIMLEILKQNYSVLMTDLDVVLFRNPWQYFTCEDCDVHFQMDRVLLNSGFVFARPTLGSLLLYSKAWQHYLQYHKAHDQAYINMAAHELTQKKAVRIHKLSRRIFPCGVYYFQQDSRMFHNLPPCEQCVIAHNNYIGSIAAKIYRFRENLLWVVNEEQYYDDPRRRYLTFANSAVFQSDVLQIEMQNRALKNALYIAQLLNRTLILPDFRCCDCKLKKCDRPRHRCSLLSVLRLKTFEKYFHNAYREHSFLKNPLVPSAILQSVSPFVNITSLTLTEVKTSLVPFEGYAVVNTSAVYDILPVDNLQWQRIEKAVECSDYEQWDPLLNGQQ